MIRVAVRLLTIAAAAAAVLATGGGAAAQGCFSFTKSGAAVLQQKLTAIERQAGRIEARRRGCRKTIVPEGTAMAIDGEAATAVLPMVRSNLAPIVARLQAKRGAGKARAERVKTAARPAKVKGKLKSRRAARRAERRRLRVVRDTPNGTQTVVKLPDVAPVLPLAIAAPPLPEPDQGVPAATVAPPARPAPGILQGIERPEGYLARIKRALRPYW